MKENRNSITTTDPLWIFSIMILNIAKFLPPHKVYPVQNTSYYVKLSLMKPTSSQYLVWFLSQQILVNDSVALRTIGRKYIREGKHN